MKSLEQINQYLSGDMHILKHEKWLKYLALSNEHNINFERINKLSDIKKDFNLLYVKRSLELLDTLEIKDENKLILEEVLKWSEVAKTGNSFIRNKWNHNKFNLYAHNIGSSQIYAFDQINDDFLIKTLIETHGLIGQYIRGEVPLISNQPLYDLLKQKVVSKDTLFKLLINLNYCVLGAVSILLWESSKSQVESVIKMILEGDFENGMTIKERIRALRKSSIENGERFDELWNQVELDSSTMQMFENVCAHYELWYVEAALHDFTFDEFTKIIGLIYFSSNQNLITQLSFENLMRDIHYDRNGIKKVNLYKKRIIERYLQSMSFSDIENNEFKQNIHVKHVLKHMFESSSTYFFEFEYSLTSSKLIEFCEIAEKSDKLYEKAVIMLFDLFDLRKDSFDRFYNEASYLDTMNKSIVHKSIILDYITGNKVVDIGPGGGALMDMIEQRNPNLNIIGLDISKNVIESLLKKKKLESRKWDVLYGDALSMTDYIQKQSVDTIIFSSIIHEMFSYIEYKGKKFNHLVIKDVLKSAFEVLKPGGRIIIRDGIMSQPKNQNRIIKFRSDEGLSFLENYTRDFKGRKIEYTVIDHNEVLMNINDAMEFLYTYTWGQESYVHEVNEQFGYFTPTEYKTFIQEIFGNTVKLIKFDHYLQEGYAVALSPKIEFYDEKRMEINLPESTCFIVIEKIK